MPLNDPQALVDGAAQSRRRTTVWLVAANLAVAVLLIVLDCVVLMRSHQAFETQAKNVADGLAAVAQLNIQSDIDRVDAVIRATTSELERLLSAPGGVPDATLNEVLRSRFDLLTDIEAIRLTDTQGLVRWGTGLPPGPPRNVADRAYFIEARHLPQPRTLIAGPLTSRVSGHRIIAFMRALHVHGVFAGLVYVSIDAEQFRHMFERYSLEPLDAVTMRRDDHELVARFSPGSPNQGQIGDSAVSPQAIAALAANPRSGSFVSRAMTDGHLRTTSYRALDSWPFVVYAGISNERFFALWRQQAVMVVALSALVWLLVALATSLVQRAHRRGAATMQALANQGKHIQILLQEQTAMLDNDLVGMVRVEDRIIVWRNRAVERILGYGPGELQGQPVEIVYWDAAQFKQVGVDGYAALRDHGHYRAQIRMRRKSGEPVWIDFAAVPFSDKVLFAMLVDITAMKQAHEELAHAAFHDALTQLPNRVLLLDRITQAQAMARREHKRVAICYLDLDGFKAVNDEHGHDAGDHVLQTIAGRLLAGLRPCDSAARLGGDEFVLVLAALEGEDWKLVLDRVIQSIGQPVLLSCGTEVRVGATAGVTLFKPEDPAGAHELIESADHKMLRGKREGKGHVVLV